LGAVRPIELQVVGAQLQAENITTLAQYRALDPPQPPRSAPLPLEARGELDQSPPFIGEACPEDVGGLKPFWAYQKRGISDPTPTADPPQPPLSRGELDQSPPYQGGFRGISGAKEILVQRSLTAVVKDCGPENEAVARIVLFLLTNANGTRPQKTQEDLETDLVDLGLTGEIPKLDLVLEVLVGSGLVFLFPDTPANYYQLVHDYLVSFIRNQQESDVARLQAALEREREQRERAEAKLSVELQQRLNAEEQATKFLKQRLWLSRMMGFALVGVILVMGIFLYQTD
jgi:hypothetical protein